MKQEGQQKLSFWDRKVESRAAVLRFRFQTSVHVGVYPRLANCLFCQIRTFK